MLINFRNALMTGKRTPTAKDYVQDGLVAMWDGIENAGWGTHDVSATTWKDLIHEIKFTLPSTGSDVYGWTGTTLRRTGVSGISCESYDLGLSDRASPYTIEFCIGFPQAPSAFDNSYYFAAYNNTSGRLFFSSSSLLQVTPDANWYYSSGISAPFGLNTISLVKTDDFKRMVGSVASYYGSIYRNGSYVRDCESRTGCSLPLALFRAGRDWKETTIMDCAGIRIYNRNLTAYEIAHNYKIDKARFGLT